MEQLHSKLNHCVIIAIVRNKQYISLKFSRLSGIYQFSILYSEDPLNGHEALYTYISHTAKDLGPCSNLTLVFHVRMV